MQFVVFIVHSSMDPPVHPLYLLRARKISLIEGKAKCRHLKQFSCEGTLRQVFSMNL